MLSSTNLNRKKQKKVNMVCPSAMKQSWHVRSEVFTVHSSSRLLPHISQSSIFSLTISNHNIVMIDNDSPLVVKIQNFYDIPI